VPYAGLKCLLRCCVVTNLQTLYNITDCHPYSLLTELGYVRLQCCCLCLFPRVDGHDTSLNQHHAHNVQARHCCCTHSMSVRTMCSHPTALCPTSRQHGSNSHHHHLQIGSSQLVCWGAFDQHRHLRTFCNTITHS